MRVDGAVAFGLFTGTTGITWPQLVDLWQHAEATGWDAACVTDHFMPNVPDPVDETLECWTALAGLALATRRMRIGTLVSGNTYRHPAVLAKMATTVDIISGGRLICGLGGAWQRNEHVAYGIPFYSVGERLGRLGEVGVHQLFIPTFLPRWNQERLDRFMTEVAPAFR